MPFVLRKWYLDCVTARGDAFIGYSARLRWDALRLRYTSALVVPATGDATETLSFLPVGAPSPTPRGLRWRCRRLGLVGAWHARAAPIERRLLGHGEAEAGIEWCCVAPAARARVHVRGSSLPGLGYAERLTLALEPWRLPFHTLHWGRFLAAGHSLVWIVWEGDAAAGHGAAALPSAAPEQLVQPPAGASRPPGSACFVFWDSRPCEVVEFSPSRLVTAGGAVLELARERVLRAGPIVSASLRALPCLGARVPSSFLAAREEKWLSRGCLRPGRLSSAPLTGWAIHEMVRFR